MTTPIRDLDAWRRVCLEAYRNLPTDTAVTMGRVDAVLVAGAREAAAADTSTMAGSAEYEHLLDRVCAVTGTEREDADAILTWCASDAAALLPGMIDFRGVVGETVGEQRPATATTDH